jgi:uncharacterized membrane protein YebE (DUF533 family)
MDMNRLLGALLGGAAQPPRRRRRRAPTLIGGRSTEARIGRLIAGVAAGAVEALMKGQATPAPPEPIRQPVPRESPRDSRAPTARPWGATPPRPAPAPAAEPDAEAAEDLLLVRAMIAAAQADGALDATERRAIAAQLDAAGLDADERDFVLADFDQPMDIQALAAAATDPMLAARIYAAAVAGAGEITPGERAWLDGLARALRLDRAAAAAIEQRLAA